MKKMPEAPKWIINALLLAAVLMILSAMLSCKTVPVEPKTPVIFWEPHSVADNVLALTTCTLDGVPAILLIKKVEIREARFVLVHEFTHIAQMKSHAGGCFGFQKQYSTDSVYRFRTEAEAYCAEVQAMIREGESAKEGVYFLVSHMRPYMPDWKDERLLQNIPCVENSS